MFLSLADRDKAAGLVAARRFAELGFSIVATAGHRGGAARREGIPVEGGGRPRSGERRRAGIDAVELISLGQGRPGGEHAAGPRARGPTAPTSGGPPPPRGIPCLTTVAAALAAAAGHRRVGATERRPCGRCRSTTATASCGSRSDARLRRDERRPARDRRHCAVDGRRRWSCRTRSSTASGTFGHGAEVARARATRRGSVRSPSSRSPPSRGRASPRRGCTQRPAAGC